jgi:hypothetical protein
MKKLSSYKKLKKKNRELTNDIYEIIVGDNAMVKKKWQMLFDLEKAFLAGDSNIKNQKP